MSDNEKLQSMLDNLINQKPEDAQVDFHTYLQDKMQGIINPNAPTVDEEEPQTPENEE